jgi:hypothetical protein
MWTAVFIKTANQEEKTVYNFTDVHARRQSKEKLMCEDVATAVSRFIQAEESVTHMGDSLEEAIAETYAERRNALSELPQWDEADNVAAAIRRLIKAQQAIQDWHDAGVHSGADDADLEAAYAEREAAIAQLIAASKRPTVTWPPSSD